VLSHCENNYGGAVRRLNAIEERLAALDFETATVFTINGLKREQFVAMNSMILHELYFAGLGSSDMRKRVRDALARDWQSEFVAMRGAQGGGSGSAADRRRP
jgi:Fe-Mn family superoxide dismutase